MSAASSKLEIILQAKDQATPAFKSAAGGLSSLEGAAGKVGGALAGMGKDVLLAGTAVGGVLVAGLAGAVKSAASFESRMSAVKAASGATGGELATLSAKALEFGAASDLAGIDATDAATAMEQLAKGGVGVSQMAEAAHGALLLASAGEISVAEAADTAVRAMNIFGLSGADVGRVADTISAAAGKSATDVGQLNAAFNQSASVAQGAGLSLEQLSGTLALLAQHGLQGSDAGTSLRTAIQRLTAPTDVAAAAMKDLGIQVFDAGGKTRNWDDIVENLKTSLSGLSDAQRDAALQTIFGSDSIRVANVLYKEGGKATKDWTANVTDAGYAARQGAIRNDNLAGSFEQLKASLQTAAITVGTALLPVMRRATDETTKLVGAFLTSKDAQAAVQRFADGAARDLGRVIAFFQRRDVQDGLKEWGLAALDVGKSVVALAGDVGEKLGPPLKAALGWFQGLDEQGKKNAIGFLAVAGAAVKFRDELGTLRGVIGDVITLLERKAVAKVALTKANAALAGSAATTAVQMAAVGAAVGDAAAVTALAAAPVAALAGGWRAISDATGGTAKLYSELETRQAAVNIVMAAGGTAIDDNIVGFGHYLDAANITIATQDQLVAAWNRYLLQLRAAGVETGGATIATTTFGNAATALAASMSAGVIPAVTGLTTGALAAAPAMGNLAAGALAAGSAMMGNLAGGALAASAAMGPAGAAARGMSVALYSNRDAANDAARALDAYKGQLGELDARHAALSTNLGILQAAWDANEEAIKKAGFATQAQLDLRAKLIPAIAYDNSQLGLNSDAQLQNALATNTADQALKNHALAADISAAALQRHRDATRDSQDAQQQASAAGAAFSAGLGVTGFAAAIAAGKVGDYTNRVEKIPPKAGTVVTADTADAITGIGAVTGAIDAVPKSFTITAYANINPAAKGILDLSNMLPRSPAKEGPFKTLPNWDALFENFGPALDRARDLFSRFGDDALKQAAETVGSIAGALRTGIGALNDLGTFKAPGPHAAGTFLDAFKPLIAGVVEAAKEYKEEGLKAAGDFADTGGKVGALVKSGVAGLADLADFAAPGAAAIADFKLTIEQVVRAIADTAIAMGEDAYTAAGQFAESAGKVVSLASGALGLFKDLKDAGQFAHITETMKALDDAVYAALPYIERIGFNLGDVAQRLAPKWGDDTGKAVTLVKSTVDLFQSLGKDTDNFVHVPQVMQLLDDAFYSSMQYLEEMAFNSAAWELAANTWQVNVSMGVAELKKGFAALQSVPSSFPSLPGIPSTGVPIGLPPGHQNTAGVVNNYNVNVSGDVYDGARFNDRVVTAMADAQQRGRL